MNTIGRRSEGVPKCLPYMMVAEQKRQTKASCRLTSICLASICNKQRQDQPKIVPSGRSLKLRIFCTGYSLGSVYFFSFNYILYSFILLLATLLYLLFAHPFCLSFRCFLQFFYPFHIHPCLLHYAWRRG